MKSRFRTDVAAILLGVLVLLAVRPAALAHDQPLTPEQRAQVDRWRDEVLASESLDHRTLSAWDQIVADVPSGELSHSVEHFDGISRQRRSELYRLAEAITIHRLVRSLGNDAERIAHQLAGDGLAHEDGGYLLATQPETTAVRQVLLRLSRYRRPAVRAVATKALFHIARMGSGSGDFDDDWVFAFTRSMLADRDAQVAATAACYAAYMRRGSTPESLIPALRDARGLAANEPPFMSASGGSVAESIATTLAGLYSIQALPWDPEGPTSESIDDALTFCLDYAPASPSASGWAEVFDRTVLCKPGSSVRVSESGHALRLVRYAPRRVDGELRVDVTVKVWHEADHEHQQEILLDEPMALAYFGTRVSRDVDAVGGVVVELLVDPMARRCGDVRLRVRLWQRRQHVLHGIPKARD